MASHVLVGIDLGTTACKAVAFDLHGSVLAEGRAPLTTALLAALASVAAGVYPDLPAAMAAPVHESDVFEPRATAQ